MNPAQGNPQTIITLARQLGIPCRPIHWGLGAAYDVSTTEFHLVNWDFTTRPLPPRVEDFLRDWELVTMDILSSEHRKDTEVPW